MNNQIEYDSDVFNEESSNEVNGETFPTSWN